VKILPLSFVGILLVATAATDSAHVNSITNPLLFQIAEATTTTDMSFGAKALEFLTYCNNQFSQTPISSMTTDTLVFCTMVYDWYLMGCNNNNAIVAPIIAAQCKDPVIIQQVVNYKTQIDIRIQQIVKIEVSPPGDGGGNGKLHDLAISITIAKNPITRGNVQTITVTVSDSKSNEKIEGAIVKVSVKYASGTHTEELGSKTTDSSGRASFSWTIGAKSIPGIFTVSVQASVSGYKPASKTTTFEVVAKNDNTTLPIANNTIVNDTSRVIVNDTDISGNETGPSDGEQGDTGSDNGNVTLQPPDPCIENPSLPECTLSEPPPLCEEDSTAEGCETLQAPPPTVEPQIEEGETADEEEVEGTTELTEDEEEKEEESEDFDDEEEEGETESESESEESSSDEEE
jgi:hypothetical protein